MANTMDSFHCTGEGRTRTLLCESGAHGEPQFDIPTSRRKATSVIHEHKIRYNQPSATNMAAYAGVIEVFLQNTEIVEIVTMQESVPDGDRTWTIQLALGSAASAYTSILSGGTPISMSSADAARTLKTTTPTTTAAVRGQSLKLTIAVAGSAGTHPQGGTVIIKTREHPAA